MTINTPRIVATPALDTFSEASDFASYRVESSPTLWKDRSCRVLRGISQFFNDLFTNLMAYSPNPGANRLVR
jgi:hypothetical protein